MSAFNGLPQSPVAFGSWRRSVDWLDRAKGMLDVIVVDRANKTPTEN
jgi:hypothetical protein